MKYEIIITSRFKKDYKLIKKQGLNTDLLKSVVSTISQGKELEPKHHDHELTGNYKGFRECHISPDWLLIYRKDEEVLILTLSRTGSHSDLF